MAVISDNLKDCGFIAVRPGSKLPLIGKGEDWNNHILTYDQANEELAKGNNVAIVGGINNYLVVDCDNKRLYEAFTGLMYHTYEEQSITGNFHLIYKAEWDLTKDDNIDFNVDKEHLGELRAHRRYVLIAPSKAKDENKGIFDIRDYKVVKDKKPCLIGKSDIEKIKKQLLIKEKIEFEEKEKDNSRSGLEYRKIIALILSGKDKDSIFDEMLAYSKWAESTDAYREYTYSKALSYVSEIKPQKATNNFDKPLDTWQHRDFEKLKKDKDFLVQDFIYPRTVTLFYSPPGEFKSLLALHMSQSLASGKDWLGFKTKRTPVLYCDKENNDQTIKDRIIKLYKGHNLKRKNYPLYILRRTGDLLDSNFIKRLKELIIEKGIKLVVFDTLHRFADYDENKSDDINRLYNEVFIPIKEEFGCSILFLHHSTKPSESGKVVYRGSSDFLGMVDTAYLVRRTKTEGKKTNDFLIINEKSRAGEIAELYGQIDFSDNDSYIKIIKTFAEVEQDKKIDKLKELTTKVTEILKKGGKMKRINIEDALTLESFKFSTSTLKRVLKFLVDNEYVILDEKNFNYFWRTE